MTIPTKKANWLRRNVMAPAAPLETSALKLVHAAFQIDALDYGTFAAPAVATLARLQPYLTIGEEGIGVDAQAVRSTVSPAAEAGYARTLGAIVGFILARDLHHGVYFCSGQELVPRTPRLGKLVAKNLVPEFAYLDISGQKASLMDTAGSASLDVEDYSSVKTHLRDSVYVRLLSWRPVIAFKTRANASAVRKPASYFLRIVSSVSMTKLGAHPLTTVFSELSDGTAEPVTCSNFWGQLVVAPLSRSASNNLIQGRLEKGHDRHCPEEQKHTIYVEDLVNGHYAAWLKAMGDVAAASRLRNEGQIEAPVVIQGYTQRHAGITVFFSGKPEHALAGFPRLGLSLTVLGVLARALANPPANGLIAALAAALTAARTAEARNTAVSVFSDGTVVTTEPATGDPYEISL